MNDVLSKEKLAEILAEIVEMEPTDPRFVEMSALLVAYYESMRISLERTEKERDGKEAARRIYSEEYGKLLENHIAQHDRLEKAESELLVALRRPGAESALEKLSGKETADAICEGIRLGLREGLKPLREAMATASTGGSRGTPK